MDLYTAIWILLWGLIPPIATGLWAYRQGKKGLEMAMEARDIALKKVEELHGQLDLYAMMKKPDPVTGKSPMQEIRESICASIDGKIGNYVKEVREAQAAAPPDILGGLFGSFIRQGK